MLQIYINRDRINKPRLNRALVRVEKATCSNIFKNKLVERGKGLSKSRAHAVSDIVVARDRSDISRNAYSYYISRVISTRTLPGRFTR